MKCLLLCASGIFVRCDDIAGPYTPVSVRAASTIEVEDPQDIVPFLSVDPELGPLSVVEFVPRRRRTITLNEVTLDCLQGLLEMYHVLRFRNCENVFEREGDDWRVAARKACFCERCASGLIYEHMSVVDAHCPICRREFTLKEPTRQIVYERVRHVLPDERPEHAGKMRQLTRAEEAEHIAAVLEDLYAAGQALFSVEMEDGPYATSW